MIINKIKEYRKGIRISKSVVENLQDLMYMVRSKPTNIEAEKSRIEKQNEKYSYASKEVLGSVEKILKDNTVKTIYIYIKDENFELYKRLLKQYTSVVDIKFRKSNSIKGGVTCEILRKS